MLFVYLNYYYLFIIIIMEMIGRAEFSLKHWCVWLHIIYK